MKVYCWKQRVLSQDLNDSVQPSHTRHVANLTELLKENGFIQSVKKKKTPKKNDRVVVSSQRESFVNTVGCFSA